MSGSERMARPEPVHRGKGKGRSDGESQGKGKGKGRGKGRGKGKGSRKGKGKGKGTFTQGSISLNNVSNSASLKIRRPPPVRSQTQNTIYRKIIQRKANNTGESRPIGLTLKQRRALDKKGTPLNNNTTRRLFQQSKQNHMLKPYVKPHYVNGQLPEYPNQPEWVRSISPPYRLPNILNSPNSPYQPESPKSEAWFQRFRNQNYSPPYNPSYSSDNSQISPSGSSVNSQISHTGSNVSL